MIKNICRFCGSPLSHVFVDLGTTPLANSYLSFEMLNAVEPFYPLRAFVCDRCFLVQLEEFEKPENIFSNYAYFSSFSSSWLKHSKEFAEKMTKQFILNEKSLVVEIASNDGYLLQYFKEKKIPVLGIEPAANIAKTAQEKGIPTIIQFFGIDTANHLIQQDKKANLLVANNVLAHVPDLNDFVAGMKILLEQNGLISIEIPHLLNLIRLDQFDTIYHEHFSYFSLLTLKKICEQHQLIIFDVEELSTHGGSLRIFVKHENDESHKTTMNVDRIIKKEIEFGLNNMSTYQTFQKRVDSIRDSIREFIVDTQKKGKIIVCYGAPAKGNTLLNYCKINKDIIEYTTDLSPYKQGMYLPGSHIPIKNPELIRNTKPDFLLILPWNIKDEIIEQLKFVREWGGKFVIPIPEVKVI